MKNYWFALFCVLSLHSYADVLQQSLFAHCETCIAQSKTQTGAFILERGEQALMSRAWLVDHSAKTIDVQYFIWSTDNIGILASEALLRAADRGVKVRVLVDDLLIDAEADTLLLLDLHPNVEIKIYNPQHAVGVSWWRRLLNIVSNFRKVNQRMHDKTAIFDGVVGITGGRNMADEYFDFDHHYNFRDRDVLLVGKSVADMSENFDEFWRSELSRPVAEILASEASVMTIEQARAHWKKLHQYAQDESNYERAIKESLLHFNVFMDEAVSELVWGDARFINDAPGKNANTHSLAGGGQATSQLLTVLESARQEVLIESPYLVLSDDALKVFSALIRRGVRVQVVTNSLASTDNLMAYSGYHKQRDALLAAGMHIYEFKPDAAVQQQLIQRYKKLEKNPVFALHAKSMVVDGKIAYIGTFNLDPRSMNLNTEVGLIMVNETLAGQLKANISLDMLPENSWHITKGQNADSQVSWMKRLKLFFYTLLPMQSVL